MQISLKETLISLINCKQFPVLAEVTKTYSEKGKYFVDCEELSNLYEKTGTRYVSVPLPKIWGSTKSGIWAMPSKESIVILNFLNGDINFPVVANVLGNDHDIDHPEDSFIIQINNTQVLIKDNEITLTNGNGTCSVRDKISIKNNLSSLIDILKGINSRFNTLSCSSGTVIVPPNPVIDASINNLLE